MPEADPTDALDRTPDHWCQRFTPGHAVHWIQVKLAVRTPSIAYTLVRVAGVHATVRHEGTGTEERWRLHDPTRLLAAAVVAGSSTVALHEHGLATIRLTEEEPEYFYPCRVPEEWVECTADGPGPVPGIA